MLRDYELEDDHWCPDCSEPREVCDGWGTCPMSEAQRKKRQKRSDNVTDLDTRPVDAWTKRRGICVQTSENCHSASPRIDFRRVIDPLEEREYRTHVEILDLHSGRVVRTAGKLQIQVGSLGWHE